MTFRRKSARTPRPSRTNPNQLARRRRFVASLECLEARLTLDATYHNLASGNLSQDWTNAAMIATDDNWSGVLSIEGFRGDNLTAATNSDPQTLLLEDTAPVLDVNANNTAPDTFATGGVAEFAITNPSIGLNGSGTADAPYIQLYLNTTGRNTVVLAFNARDLDGSADDAIQQIAVHYRVGTTGTWTNLPAGYIADATSGAAATLVTARSVTLPAAAENQAQVQIRIMTANAPGNDEWVGIDDIVVSSQAASGGNQPPVNTAPTGSLPGTEDTPLPITSISVADPDAANTLTTTVSVLNNTFGTFAATPGAGTATVTFSNSNATVQIVGSQTNVNAALQTLIFTPAANRAVPPDTAPTVTVVTNDGTVSDTDTFSINLAEINDPPVGGADALAAVNEDAPPINIPVATLLANDSKGAPNEDSTQTLTISSTFSTVVGGTVQLIGANVVFTPTPNYSGPASFVYSVTDNGLTGGMPSPLSGSGTASFTINPVNDVPTFTPGSNQTVPFGSSTAQTVSNWATAITAGGGESQTLTFNVTNNSNSALFTAGGQPAVSSTGTLTFTPVGTIAGTATITLVLMDNGGIANGGFDTTAPITFTITVTSPGNTPTISTINPVTISEDATVQSVNFTGVSDGGDPQQQAITISTSSSNPTLIPTPTVNYSSPNATGSLNFTPTANNFGTSTITVTVRDSGLDLIPGNADDLTTTTTFLVTVNPVNDNPTITPFAINPFNAVEDDPAIPFVFNGISAGPNETQSLQVTAASSNQALALDPVVTYTSPAATATVTVNLIPNRSGTTTITVTVRDAGLDGTLNTADDATTLTTEVINVAAVNDKPTITTSGNQTVAFNSGPQTVAGFASVVSFGAPDEAVQAINNYVVNSNSNPGLFSAAPTIAANGTLSYTPAVGQQGTATILISGVDNGGSSNGGQPTSDPVSFTITVNPPSPNATPTLNAISDLTIDEGAPLQTINLTGITDGGDATPQALAVSVSSSNSSLVPIIANYASPNTTGTLTFTSPVNGNGSTIVTVTVRDSGLDLIPGNGDDLTVTRTFNVTVNPVNDVPSFVIGGNHTVNEDAPAQSVPAFAMSISAGPNDENTQTLTFNITGNSNPSLFAAGPTISPTGTLSYTPDANAFGSATISVTLSDNGGTANGGVDTTAVQTFTITLNPVNDAPTFAVGPNITVSNAAGPQSVAQVTSIAAGPANEAGQTVSLSITNISNPAIFATQPSLASNGTLTFTPAAGAFGTATITLVAQDNGGTANGGVDTSAPQSFTITVLANSPPTINPISNKVIDENSSAQTVNLSGITAGGEVQNLSVTASSNNLALIPTPSVSYSSPATTGALTYVPVAGQSGLATITVNVRDAGFDGVLNTADDGTASTSFTVQINPVDDPPVANDQTRAAVINTPVSGALTASDPDSAVLTYGIVVNPVLGTLTAFNPATGAFTYTPTPNAMGLDLFTFSVSDGNSTDTGIVRIAIQGAQPVVTPSGGDLIIIGTPDPDMIIVTPVSAGVVRVRTDLATAHYPVTGQLIVNSGEGADYVVATGVIVPTTLDLAGGDDYASSGMQDDTIIGGAGNDQINASGGNNIVWGDTIGEQDLPTGGNDVLSSLNGNDTIYGGGANDQIFSGGGNDYVNAGQGDDTVSAGDGNDRVYGGGGIDSLYGDEGDDIITGGAGSDSLVGRTGNDILIGGLGGDSINGDDGIDLLFGGDTTNSASSTAGDANDLALMAMMVSWNASHPIGLALSVSAGNDGSADNLLGFTGDDHFYVNANDSVSDFGLPFMGDDRFFTG